MAVSLVLLTGKVSATVEILHSIPCISIGSSLSTVYICSMQGFTRYMFDYIDKSHQSQVES